VARFLLDANLSPKIAKFLSREIGLDVVSLHTVGLQSLSDPDVIRLARRQQRVIITLDRDFAEHFYRNLSPPIGVIYLNLPLTLRYISDINQLLSHFFTVHADTIDLDHCLVTLTGSTVQITRPENE
jgi:predicted nuclease of predicted toxin-antitoxin system